MSYAGIHIPGGCDVLVGDDEASLVNFGVLPEDSEAVLDISYKMVEVKGSKNEDVLRYATDMSGKMNFTLYQLQMDNIARTSKGLMTVTNVEGDPVAGQLQTIAANWENLRFYKLAGQNANGAVPTVSVSGETAGALAEGDDYFLAKGADGDWYIYFDTSGTQSLVTTEVITLTLDFTPTAHKRVAMGAASVEIETQVVRFLKTQGGKKFQATLWSATNSKGLSIKFPPSKSEKPTSLDVEMEGGLDSSRAAGDQLIEIIDEIGV